MSDAFQGIGFRTAALFGLICISLIVGCGGDDQGVAADAAVDAASADANGADGPVVDAASIDVADFDGPADSMIDGSPADAADIDSPVDASADAPTDASVDAALPPSIASISIVGYGNSVQVRQGAGMVRVAVSGSNLAPISSVSVGSLAVTVASGSSDTLALLDLVVPHAAALGYRDLVIMTPGGSDTIASAIAVTEITSGPSGSDASGRGTPDSPFRTAAHAVPLAGSGDTVHLIAGTYGPLETWPLFVSSGTSLKGDGVGATVLNGNGASTVMSGSGATLESMTIMNFSTCVRGSGNTLRNLSLDGCTVSGVDLGDSAIIEDTVVRSPTIGIRIDLLAGGSVTLRRVQVVSTAPQTQENWTGIDVRHSSGSTATGTIAMEDSVVSDSYTERFSSVGVNLIAPGGSPYSIRVRRTRIETSRAVWLVGGDFQSTDFGTTASPGANVLVSSLRCIEDIRDARAVADGPIASFVGTTLNGMSLPPGTILTGPAFSFPYYYLHNANTRVGF